MRRRRFALAVAVTLAAVGGALLMGSPLADRSSNIGQTKHNLSVTGPGATRATSETEVCVFCHTPHGASTAAQAPLWNRRLGTQSYTVYESSSLDAQTIAGQLLDQPAGSSKLCLSCHDGTLAIGTVNVLAGQRDVTIPMSNTGAGGVMPPGQGAQSGFTRNLGTDLRNDHPLSVTYDSQLASTDGELFDPTLAAHIGVRQPGVRHPVPLEPTGAQGQAQVQCGTCHDPHLFDTAADGPIKFLRLQRFQIAPPVQGVFNPSNDMVCRACHDKKGWAASAHATPTVADETYSTSAANQSHREFPVGLPVWRAGCLNCHDPHTVHGARRLAREGTDSLATPKSGGASAIEETCYQCHSSTPAINNASGQVADIRSEFQLARRMPITSTDQQAGQEVHDITNADFIEPQSRLGKGNGLNRHAECTDCHNPHRVRRNQVFNASGIDTGATHAHAASHGNIASGALRGAWGVEPVYGGLAFLSLPQRYDVKSGDGGDGASTAVASTHLTREYQICLKCHSDYGYNDSGAYPLGGRPGPGDSFGTTPAGTNNLSQYTNQAMEFQAPQTHQGETTTSDSGAGVGFSTNNHRSWHPVMEATGRTPAIRKLTTGAFLAPWNAGIGSQTMYCSDCHGGNTAANSVVPQLGRPWGPHGSENNFILKGIWSALTGSGTRDAPGDVDPNNGVCFKCHDFRTYADRNGHNRNDSGFSGPKSNNLHAFHTDKIERIRCSWCHAAVPHGWKNKALLVNLNDVGPEAGRTAGTEIPINGSNEVYNQGPYYLNAKLKVRTFAASGTWQDSNCGSASGQPDVGREWMKNVCSNPP